MPLTIIGVDADDTLWHTETVFRLTHKRFNALLAEFADEDTLEARLAAIERENMKAYGYGAKGFTLSRSVTARFRQRSSRSCWTPAAK
jgi:putative hydrolase of the HAD superfamily